MVVPVQHNEIQKICCGDEFSTVSVNEKKSFTPQGSSLGLPLLGPIKSIFLGLILITTEQTEMCPRVGWDGYLIGFFWLKLCLSGCTKG